jgi:hypothetical protein
MTRSFREGEFRRGRRRKSRGRTTCVNVRALFFWVILCFWTERVEESRIVCSKTILVECLSDTRGQRRKHPHAVYRVLVKVTLVQRRAEGETWYNAGDASGIDVVLSKEGVEKIIWRIDRNFGHRDFRTKEAERTTCSTRASFLVKYIPRIVLKRGEGKSKVVGFIYFARDVAVSSFTFQRSLFEYIATPIPSSKSSITCPWMCTSAGTSRTYPPITYFIPSDAPKPRGLC